jgi:menaquinone-dependent protoporphyrinogen IX oxidase
MYPFINLENVDQKELDQFVIGSWVQYHRKPEVIKQELSEKIEKAVTRKAALKA